MSVPRLRARPELWNGKENYSLEVKEAAGRKCSRRRSPWARWDLKASVQDVCLKGFGVQQLTFKT